MWAVHESFDASRRTLILDLVAGGTAPVRRGPPPTLLGTFPDLGEATVFIEGYLATARRGADHVVTRVDWGKGLAC